MPGKRETIKALRPLGEAAAGFFGRILIGFLVVVVGIVGCGILVCWNFIRLLQGFDLWSLGDAFHFFAVMFILLSSVVAIPVGFPACAAYYTGVCSKLGLFVGAAVLLGVLLGVFWIVGVLGLKLYRRFFNR